MLVKQLLDVLWDWFTRLILAILACGPVPNHIAFIMDGNRRYAGKRGRPGYEGHYNGFSALHSVLRGCLHLGIRSVTVYAFAIDNFRRTPIEVETLMNICEQKLYELCQHGELLEKHDVRLRVLGKTDLLPPNVLAAVEKAEQLTRLHTSATLNVMMPYASREEITSAMRNIIKDNINKKLDIDNINETELDDNMYTKLAGNEPVDILVRTSGVKRLSDFLLWQCCENVQVHFVPVYWPEFGLRHMIPILLDYQRKVWSRQLLLPQ